jgi:glycosyltransferase involved in cell wall biosynthesis
MKIAFFDFNINFGGAPRGTLSLSYRLKHKEVDLTILDAYGMCSAYSDKINDYNLKYEVFNKNSKYKVIGGTTFFNRLVNFMKQFPDLIKVLCGLRRSIKKNDFKIVWVNNKKSLMFLCLASLFLNVKITLYYRGWGDNSQFDSVFRFFVNIFCDSLIGHSRATVNNLIKMFPNKTITYVPNSVDIDIKAHEYERIDNNIISILLPAARPVLEKGHMTAVKALVLLKEQNLKFNLIFPGKVSTGVDSTFLNELNRYIQENDLYESVQFIGWKDSLEQTIIESNIVILPSYTEGFPRVLIEAMLLKRPIIATPVGGIPEAIIHDETGYIVDIDDYENLAKYILQIVRNPIKTENLVNAAFKKANIQFSSVQQTELVFDVFNKVLSK